VARAVAPVAGVDFTAPWFADKRLEQAPSRARPA